MSKARGCGVAVLAVLVVCGVGGFAAFRFGGASDRRELEAQLTRAARLGLPNDFTKIWPAPKHPADNAAPIYTALAKDPHGLSKASSDAAKVGYPESEAERKAIDAAIAPAAGDLARFEKAAGMRECRFVRKPSIDTLFPEYAVMKGGVSLLGYRARREASAGDPLSAMRTLDTGAKVSAQVGGEAVLIAKLVQIATEAIVLRAAQEILADYGKRSDVRAAARKVLADLGPAPSIKDGMKCEWAFQRLGAEGMANGSVALNMVSGLSGEGENSGSNVEGAMFGLMMKTPAGRAKQELNAARTFLDYYEGMPEDATEVAQARAASRNIDATLAKGGVELTLAKILMPVFGQANDAAAKAVAERRAFAALLTALDSPVPPKWLPVKGTAALDPFTDDRLIYHASPKEIRIWSVGPDGTDDGGLIKNTEGASDVTVLWPYPKTRPKAKR
ncbi:hypothetical protein BH11ARM2_BH11ARM2_15650 [soil metagenome]